MKLQYIDGKDQAPIQRLIRSGKPKVIKSYKAEWALPLPKKITKQNAKDWVEREVFGMTPSESKIKSKRRKAAGSESLAVGAKPFKIAKEHYGKELVDLRYDQLVDFIKGVGKWDQFQKEIGGYEGLLAKWAVKDKQLEAINAKRKSKSLAILKESGAEGSPYWVGGMSVK